MRRRGRANPRIHTQDNPHEIFHRSLQFLRHSGKRGQVQRAHKTMPKSLLRSARRRLPAPPRLRRVRKRIATALHHVPSRRERSEPPAKTDLPSAGGSCEWAGPDRRRAHGDARRHHHEPVSASPARDNFNTNRVFGRHRLQLLASRPDAEPSSRLSEIKSARRLRMATALTASSTRTATGRCRVFGAPLAHGQTPDRSGRSCRGRLPSFSLPSLINASKTAVDRDIESSPTCFSGRH